MPEQVIVMKIAEKHYSKTIIFFTNTAIEQYIKLTMSVDNSNFDITIQQKLFVNI